jgi:hypothetical protein
MRTIGCALLLGLFTAAPSSAQDCPPPPSPSSEPWPDEVEVSSEVVGDDATIRLTRAEGEAIRCQLQRRLRRPIDRMPSDLREEVHGRRVGALWMDQGRPRIGSFWLQRRSDGTLALSDTLAMSDRARIGLVARFEKRGGRWRLMHVDVRIDHARRGRRTPAAP